MRPIALVPLLLLACAGSDPAPTSSDDGADGADGTVEESGDPGPNPYDVVVGPYNAQIRWTAWGIPHIVADDWGSMGFGVARAQTAHHACAIADQIVMARAERARYFGPAYVDEDFSIKAQGVFAAAEAGFLDLDADLQAALVGFAAGYNAWLAETPAAEVPEACRGADWLVPITHIDVLAYYVALGELASGDALKTEIGQAQPPGGGRVQAPPPPASRFDQVARIETMGSNGWAVGRERSESGGGMLLSNTHYPWFGNRRWFEMHVTVPGEVDFYGVGLIGILFPVMGFNRDIAWTHTVASSLHFNLNLLELDPADPTRYRYDGGYLDMDATTYEIDVLQSDGAVETVSRTMYRTHHGPMINAPVLGWTPTTAVSMSDANAANLAMLPTWKGMVLADSLDALESAQWTERGIPWVNTIATDAEGNAWYGDTTRVPGWSAEAEAAWPDLVESVPFISLMADFGVIGGDGGDPLYDWDDVKPFEESPWLQRADFVANANDSHWLNHSSETLEGFSRFYGSERTPRSGRTRMNLRYLAEDGPDAASGDDGRFSLDELEAAALEGRSAHADDLLAALVERCDGVESVTVAGTDVDITASCAALAGWDGTYGLDARGFAVFREWLAVSSRDTSDLYDQGAIYAEPFDVVDPLYTPAGLTAAPDSGADPVLIELAQATQALAAAGIPADARLGDIQFQIKGDATYGVPGGGFADGTIAVASWSGGNDTLIDGPARPAVVNAGSDLTEGGYPMNYGNSWVMVMEFAADGPRARAITTYSQSADWSAK
jgi:acyl-homoserine-lactone acylase